VFVCVLKAQATPDGGEGRAKGSKEDPADGRGDPERALGRAFLGDPDDCRTVVADGGGRDAPGPKIGDLLVPDCFAVAEDPAVSGLRRGL
jgi:hypothetical protein